MKKIFLTTFAILLILSLVACSKPNEEKNQVDNNLNQEENLKPEQPTNEPDNKEETPTLNPNETTDITEDNKEEKPVLKPNESEKPVTPPADNQKPQELPKPVVTITEIRDAVAKAYGDDYLPSTTLDSTELKETYGVDNTWVSEFAAEVPMISFHVDTFIAIKATDGNTKNVETALNNYRDYLINNSLQYPVNLPKIQASKVYTKHNYVFFIMLGTVSDDILFSENEEIIAKAFSERNQLAIDTIDTLLK